MRFNQKIVLYSHFWVKLFEKTIFATMLKEVLKKVARKKFKLSKLVHILLLDLRQSSLKNIIRANVSFEHEAELLVVFSNLAPSLTEFGVKNWHWVAKKLVRKNTKYLYQSPSDI